MNKAFPDAQYRRYIHFFHGVAVAALTAITAFCIWYLASSRADLINWYTARLSPFYRQQSWATRFFTEPVKQTGNWLCALAIPVAIDLSYYLLRRRKGNPEQNGPITFYREPSHMLISLIAIMLWAGVSAFLPVAADEAFSAVHAAGRGPGLALSYYMLPNNHILFNVVNGFFGGLDLVWTGRILSGSAYVLCANIMLRWFSENGVGKWTAFAATVLCLLQFPVLGFAGQARGYEWNLFAHWWLLLITSRYFRSGRVQETRYLPIALLIGYGTVPTFLFFHAAMVLWTAIILFQKRWLVRPLFLQHLAGIAAVALFYLPALCFSGIAAFAENKYVAAGSFSIRKYLLESPPFGLNYPAYVSGGTAGSQYWGLLLAALPLLLILPANKKHRQYVLLFICTWLMLDIAVIGLRHLPFHRNLIGLFSVSLAIGLLGLQRLLQPRIRAFYAVAAVLAFLFLLGAQQNLTDWLYFYPATAKAETVRATLETAKPACNTMAFSDEAFLYRKFWQRMGGKLAPRDVASCYINTEDDADTSVPNGYVRDLKDGEIYLSRRVRSSVAQ